MIEILLGFSILLNGFFIWYIIKLLKKFLNVSEELEGLFVSLEEYSEHVNIVYKLERFYGDATLENLMKHSKAISNQAKIFRTIYDIEYEEDEEDEENFEENEE